MTHPALAGVLALLLLAASTLSACSALHRALHDGDLDHPHLCLVCSLSHGQVGPVEVALVCAVLALSFCFVVGLVRMAPLPGADHLLCPSRAPPAAGSPNMVAG